MQNTGKVSQSSHLHLISNGHLFANKWKRDCETSHRSLHYSITPTWMTRSRNLKTRAGRLFNTALQCCFRASTSRAQHELCNLTLEHAKPFTFRLRFFRAKMTERAREALHAPRLVHERARFACAEVVGEATSCRQRAKSHHRLKCTRMDKGMRIVQVTSTRIAPSPDRRILGRTLWLRVCICMCKV